MREQLNNGVKISKQTISFVMQVIQTNTTQLVLLLPFYNKSVIERNDDGIFPLELR